MYGAFVSWLLAGSCPLLEYELLPARFAHLSVLCRYGSKQVGFTPWPCGQAEMTWEVGAVLAASPTS